MHVVNIAQLLLSGGSIQGSGFGSGLKKHQLKVRVRPDRIAVRRFWLGTN